MDVHHTVEQRPLIPGHDGKLEFRRVGRVHIQQDGRTDTVGHILNCCIEGAHGG